MKRKALALILSALTVYTFAAGTVSAVGAEKEAADGESTGVLSSGDTGSSLEEVPGGGTGELENALPHWEVSGGRHLVDKDGAPVSGWYAEDGRWYLLDEQGFPLTGWQQTDGKWYYLGKDGVMLDGWQEIGGKWYLLSGGAMKTGWAKSGGKWYYFGEDGRMKTSWLTLGDKKYFLTASGAMKTGSVTEGNTVYTLSSSGAVSGSTNLSSLSNKSLGWGPGTQVDSLNRPVSALSYQEKYGDKGGVFIGENRKVIYLTLDEGYENGYTAPILDVLKEKGVSATFFITGAYLKSEPELVERMIREGHTVGNHTVNHPNLPSISIAKRAEEISRLHQQVEDRFGYTMYLMRPPEGVFSEQLLAQAQGMGYQTVLWSYAYKDWDVNSQMAPSAALSKAVGALHPGAVYLLHAVSKTNAAMMGDFIDAARAKGYTFEVLGKE